MQPVGMVRKIDFLGRICLPKELRHRYNLGVQQQMELFVTEDCIILKKYESSCILCGGDQDLRQYHSKYVCRECIHKLQHPSDDTE